MGKGFEFENKRDKRNLYPNQRGNKFEGYLEETEEEGFDINNSSYITRSWKEAHNEFFAREYLWTLSNLPIAYKDPKKAIEFFEKETGVNLSQPKEYKKLVF